jgi:hypothetical protein
MHFQDDRGTWRKWLTYPLRTRRRQKATKGGVPLKDKEANLGQTSIYLRRKARECSVIAGSIGLSGGPSG